MSLSWCAGSMILLQIESTRFRISECFHTKAELISVICIMEQLYHIGLELKIYAEIENSIQHILYPLPCAYIIYRPTTTERGRREKRKGVT